MTYDRGAIVFADDPFKGDDASRPWLIIGTDETPFHGDQYIALTLSTKTWYIGIEVTREFSSLFD